RNAVIELLKSGREVENVLVAKGEREGSINRIIAMCRENKIVVKTVDRKKLDFMCAGGNHQGVAANVPAHSYSSVDDILEYAKSKGEAPFIIICDEIEDSHNLGAIIRTAEACGAHGIIIPKRRNVGLNFIVAKTSCGALEYMPAARVTNLASTIDDLKEKYLGLCRGYGRSRWDKTDFSGGAALVVAGGNGTADSSRKCDVIAVCRCSARSIFKRSVAAGICMKLQDSDLTNNFVREFMSENLLSTK
ncbi:MAG: TrmH family RNA methyltransferase, partial [Eubacterium sp.]